jgi:hypothetical protein
VGERSGEESPPPARGGEPGIVSVPSSSSSASSSSPILSAALLAAVEEAAARERLYPPSVLEARAAWGCSVEVGNNSTLRALAEAVKFSPNPAYVPMEIFPDNLVWTVVDDGGGDSIPEGDPYGEHGSEREFRARGSGYRHIAFLMALPGNHFSTELLRCILEVMIMRGRYLCDTISPSRPFSLICIVLVSSQVAPAFPSVWFVVGNGPAHRRFTSTYSVRSFPRLLLFREGSLQSRFRIRSHSLGESQTPRLASWLSAQTGSLPSARMVKREAVDLFSTRDIMLWLSAGYVLLNFIVIIFKRRSRS